MCKLIVLDDDQIQLLIIKRMLSNYTYLNLNDTIYSTDGNSILKYLRLNTTNKEMLPEVLFIDLNMPELNGWQFLEHFKDLYPQLVNPIEVYILSSSIDPNDIKRSVKYPFVKSYFIKPITHDKLQLIMQNLH